MGWNSQDDLIDQITNNGKFGYIFANNALSVAQLAGTWTLMSGHPGTPPAAPFAGADLTYVPTDDTWAEGTLYHGGDVDPATKHMLNMGAMVVAAAGAPWLVMPIDLVGFVPLSTTNVSTNGTKTVTMTPIAAGAGTGDRYPNGEGLRLFVAVDTVLGANAPTCTIDYKDTAGNSAVTTSFTSTASMPVGALLNTGAVANKYNPFLPLAAGDTGVSDIESLTWGGTAHASGSVIIGLCAPLGPAIPIPATGLYNKYDFASAAPSYPKIRDGANITFLVFQTGATTSGGTFMADINYGYGG